MQIHKVIDKFPLDACVVTVGMFDGVHLGHSQLISELKAEAARRHLPSVVVTLWPHPKYVLTGTYGSLRLLSTLDEKIEQFENLEVDHLVVLDFTQRIAAMSAATFVREILVGRLHAAHFHMGFDHRFGSGKETLEELEAICLDAGLTCSRGTQYLAPDGSPCCSSAIRQSIASGNVEQASQILGRPYSLTGVVVHGDGIGQKIGFPTANLKVEDYKQLPLDGVYAAFVSCSGKHLQAVVDIGIRPSFYGSEHRIEAHLINFSAKIYDQTITISLISRIRDEKRFYMLEELENQIVKDVADAQEILAGRKN